MRNQFGMKCIAVFLAAWMAFTEFAPATAYAQNIEAERSYTASQETAASDALPEQSNPVHEQTSVDQEETEPAHQQEEKTLLPVYQNQTILIYTYAQLLQIGSGAAVTDTDAEADQLGKGQPVTDEDGKSVTYSLDAQYTIVQDIPLPANSVWQLPRDFTGGIAPQEQEDVSLYHADSDTIYVTNPYQLAVMASDTAETEPVMSGDTKASTFGAGQLIYPQESENTYLTYSSSHNYVLSKQFDSDTTDGTTSIVSNTEADGRDFAGQVIKTIGKKTYILIGNEQQLRAIGSDETVYGAVYQAKYHNAKWHVDTDENGNPIMLYGGDADIEKQYNGTKDYTFGEKGIEKADGALTGRCGVNQTTGEIDPNLDIDKATDEKYSSDANYIIFRDIDLSNANWTPLMFQGTMLGAKASGTSTLWDDAGISTAVARPILSHITVDQTENVEVSKLMGIGFFGTISSEASADDIGLSKGLVEVSHLELSDISVSNTAQKAYADQTLVSGLLSTVGGLVGGIVDLLLWVLTIGQVKLNVRTLLSDLLNARAADKTALATGAFAGRIVGEVEVSDCTVTQASVKSNHEYVGGFVGYAEGRTEYSGLSQTLGTVVKTLSAILNVIPGLGLGDLITILLQNALPVGNLIPSGYKNAKIENCTVSQLNRLDTQDDKERIGGFIGQQTGSWIQNCAITNSSYTVKGSQYVGGFVGLARDGEIKGTLTEGLNIDIQHFGLPASLLYQCAIQNSAYSVSGTSYVGGFSGAQAYTDAVNCSIDTGENTLSISGSGDCVGGFAGIATIGWLTNLGKDEVQDASLLKVVTSLLVSLLGDNKVGNVALLSLVGVAPSSVSGCRISAGSLTVKAGGDYAGGLIGKGDASYLTDSSKDQLDQLEFWKRGILTDYPEVRKSSVVNLQTVQGKNFVGGAAGSVGTASVAGLLNSAVGADSFLGFTVMSLYPVIPRDIR